MNTYIKQLCYNARFNSMFGTEYGGDQQVNNYRFTEDELEKFARALIHQSALIMETGVTAYPYQTFGDMARDHFGVTLRYKKVDT